MVNVTEQNISPALKPAKNFSRNGISLSLSVSTLPKTTQQRMHDISKREKNKNRVEQNAYSPTPEGLDGSMLGVLNIKRIVWICDVVVVIVIEILCMIGSGGGRRRKSIAMVFGVVRVVPAVDGYGEEAVGHLFKHQYQCQCQCRQVTTNNNAAFKCSLRGKRNRHAHTHTHNTQLHKTQY